MSKKKKRVRTSPGPGPGDGRPVVEWLSDAVQEGREYESLLAVSPRQDLNARDDLRRAIAHIEAIRGRPLLCYVANVFKAHSVPTAIGESDELPFAEMVDAVPAASREADLLLVTPGGLAHQVAKFVDKLRARFDRVEFLVPHLAMSAGTIWVLSGDELWMDSRAYLGPIDPQVRSRDGSLVPAQALITLLDLIQQAGEERIKKGQQPDWAHVQLLRNIDGKELGNVISQSNYATQLAADYLKRFKFRTWTAHSDGTPVTADQRAARALEIAQHLCSHDSWKVHSHGISRSTLEAAPLKLKIKHPEDVPGLERELRRLWAVMYWLCESTTIGKMFVSTDYSLFRSGKEVSQ